MMKLFIAVVSMLIMANVSAELTGGKTNSTTPQPSFIENYSTGSDPATSPTSSHKVSLHTILDFLIGLALFVFGVTLVTGSCRCCRRCFAWLKCNQTDQAQPADPAVEIPIQNLDEQIPNEQQLNVNNIEQNHQQQAPIMDQAV